MAHIISPRYISIFINLCDVMSLFLRWVMTVGYRGQCDMNFVTIIYCGVVCYNFLLVEPKVGSRNELLKSFNFFKIFWKLFYLTFSKLKKIFLGKLNRLPQWILQSTPDPPQQKTKFLRIHTVHKVTIKISHTKIQISSTLPPEQIRT